ncbi:hypothetical protein [Avibacterium paragallinarum]|uniref:hypothetical protein n=1 Tax=Avibacterium TaxID=292486 RepID=UPI00287A0139|nr:hypothetical protein [Pasteurella multocida]HDX1022601.1 hypothetical protein [Pasteurella multocida]
MKMTRFAKFVDKTENAINNFKCWQAPKWLKVVIILGIFSVFFSLFYYLMTFIALAALIIAFRLLPENVKNFLHHVIEVQSNNDNNEKNGYRTGHSGYGYYSNGSRID